MQFTVTDKPDLTIPEDFPLRAQLKEINHREFNWTDKKTGEDRTGANLEWWFQVTAEGKYNGRKVKGRTDAELTNNERDKFGRWARTLLGRELPIGMGLDTDDLIGLSCDLTVRHEPNAKNPDRVWEVVDELLPITSGFDLNGNPPF